MWRIFWESRAPIILEHLPCAIIRPIWSTANEEKLRAGGVDATFHRYLAHHAFANGEAIGDGRIAGTQYDAAWAPVAWDRTLTFFAHHLWR